MPANDTWNKPALPMGYPWLRNPNPSLIASIQTNVYLIRIKHGHAR